VFAGFGKHNPEFPLLNENGIQIDANLPKNFVKYRNVAIWEKEYEI